MEEMVQFIVDGDLTISGCKHSAYRLTGMQGQIGALIRFGQDT